LARIGKLVDISDADQFPRPSVPAGTADRKKRLSEAGNQIDLACKRLFAAREEAEGP